MQINKSKFIHKYGMTLKTLSKLSNKSISTLWRMDKNHQLFQFIVARSYQNMGEKSLKKVVDK